MIIGVEGGIWYEYDETNGERTAITPQRLARPTPQTRQDAPLRPVNPIYAEVKAAMYALGFLGLFSGLLAVFMLVAELVRRLM